MFYPACPKEGCGGKSTSAEPSIRAGKRVVDGWLQQQAAINHPHPYVKIGVSVLVGLNEIYKRLPGGGRKRCTKCSHEFS